MGGTSETETRRHKNALFLTFQWSNWGPKTQIVVVQMLQEVN